MDVLEILKAYSADVDLEIEEDNLEGEIDDGSEE